MGRRVAVLGAVAMGGRRAAVRGAALVVLAIGVVRCGGPSKEGGQGGECFRAEECAAGLVCIEQKCTSDLSSINIRPEGGRGPADAGGGATPD